MSVLAFINLKGGVAKTTNAVAVAEFLAEAGNRVLLIDADHQCTAGELLLGESRLAQSDKRCRTLHDLLKDMLREEFSVDSLNDYVVPSTMHELNPEVPCVFTIPCSIRIDDFEKNRSKARGEFRSTEEFGNVLNRRTAHLKRWMNANYDYAIIDCPPSMPIQVQMLMKSADAYVMPTVPDRLSVRGSFYLTDRLRRMNFKTPGLGTIWSLFRSQNAIHREMISLASRDEELFGWMPRPFDTVIPNASAIARAMEGTSHLAASLNAKYSYEFAAKFRALSEEISLRCQGDSGAIAGQTAELVMS